MRCQGELDCPGRSTARELSTRWASILVLNGQTWSNGSPTQASESQDGTGTGHPRSATSGAARNRACGSGTRVATASGSAGGGWPRPVDGSRQVPRRGPGWETSERGAGPQISRCAGVWPRPGHRGAPLIQPDRSDRVIRRCPERAANDCRRHNRAPRTSSPRDGR